MKEDIGLEPLKGLSRISDQPARVLALDIFINPFWLGYEQTKHLGGKK
jgi:hypothetical protein